MAELGKEPVVVGDKTFHKTIWDLQKYEPALELPNAIEHDTERELQKSAPAVSADKTKENEQEAPATPKKTPNLSDFEFELPSNIKNNYIAIVKNRHLSDQKINYYDKDDKDQVNIAFEDRNTSLHTSRQDDKTVYAMLDMAQSKGWSAIQLKGTEEFKQKVWLEASLRGIGVKGYEPNEKDLAELQAKQQARTTNQVEMTAQKAPEPTQENGNSQTEIQNSTTPPTHTPTGQETIYGQLQKPMNNQAYLDRIGLNFDGANVDRYAKNSDEVVEKAQDFVGKELTNIHSGIKGVISNSNIKKMISGSASDKSVNAEIHRVASANADKLFENSVFAWQYQDRNNDSNFIAIHRAIAPLKFNDEIYFAKLTVKELARERGNKIYSIEAVEVEQGKSPIPDMMSVDQDKQGFTEHRPNGALIDIIVQNAQEYNRQNQKNVENLHNYNISINQDILGNALAMKENHYERGSTSEKEVLSNNYFMIDPKSDFYIANQLNKDISEFKNHHYAIDRTSDTYFIKQMVNELNISDDVKRDFELKFNNRMTEQFYANDSYDMPHENFSLRNYAILARADLEQSLNKFNEPNKDLVIKSFDDLMVDYSKQVLAHQKNWLSLQEEKIQPVVDSKLNAELKRELKKEVTQIFQNGYKDGVVTNLDDLVRELKERGYEVKENDKSIRVTDKNGTAITVTNEPFTKIFDAVKSLKDELKPETIKANYPNIDDVNIANITAYKNYLLEQFKTPQALQKSLSELNQDVKDLANGKSIDFPTLPPNEERPVIDVRVPESGEKSRIK
ncbi:LPD7 domain-containing protein [Moraxella oculi]|uniref:LPD7 domain-containing protein n=1 Tax=Moraxella oculi TaxID=2940516 RepID=UPI00387E86EC